MNIQDCIALLGNQKLQSFEAQNKHSFERSLICLVGFPTCPAWGLMGATRPSHPRRGLSLFYISWAMRFGMTQTGTFPIRPQSYKEFLDYARKKQNYSTAYGLLTKFIVYRGIKVRRFLLNGQIGGENSLVYLDFAWFCLNFAFFLRKWFVVSIWSSNFAGENVQKHKMHKINNQK